MSEHRHQGLIWACADVDARLASFESLLSRERAEGFNEGVAKAAETTDKFTVQAVSVTGKTTSIGDEIRRLRRGRV